MFDEEYFKQVYNVNDLNKFDKHWWSNYFYSKLVRRYCHKPKGDILELGCGFGGILRRLENNFNAYGIDISDYALSKAQEQCKTAKLLCCDIEKGLRDKFHNIFFDVILARYVFEHLEEPRRIIMDCSSMLKKEGILIFAVPNTSFLLRRFKGEEWSGVKDKTHKSVKSPREWIKDVKDSGLTILRIFGDGFWDIPYFKFMPKIIQYPLLLPTVIEVVTAVPFIPLRWGENLIMVVRKK